jgi:hypothetical protein
VILAIVVAYDALLGEGCPTNFRRDQTFAAWGLSGYSWTFYRREN